METRGCFAPLVAGTLVTAALATLAALDSSPAGAGDGPPDVGCARSLIISRLSVPRVSDESRYRGEHRGGTCSLGSCLGPLGGLGHDPSAHHE